MLYFHLLQALPSPETIRRKDFQFETLKTWQECCEIWFSFFHCLMFSQERFNTWHECSERLGNLRSGFKDIAAWLDSAQHQLKVCFCLSICKRLKDRMYFTLKIFVVVRCPLRRRELFVGAGTNPQLSGGTNSLSARGGRQEIPGEISRSPWGTDCSGEGGNFDQTSPGGENH